MSVKVITSSETVLLCLFNHKLLLHICHTCPLWYNAIIINIISSSISIIIIVYLWYSCLDFLPLNEILGCLSDLGTAFYWQLVCVCVSGGRSKVQTGVWACSGRVVNMGGVVRMLSNLWRGHLTEEQEVFTSTSSAGPSTIPLSTKLGRLSSRGRRRSCRLTCASLLSSSLPWAAPPALSLYVSLHQSKPRIASLSGHTRWRRRASRTSANQSITSVVPARILLKQSTPRASCFQISLPCASTRLQPASTGHQATNQSWSTESRRRGEQKVGLHQPGGFTYKKVSDLKKRPKNTANFT